MLRQFSILLAREVESLFLTPINYAVITVALLFNGWSFWYALQQSQGNVEEAVRFFFGQSPLVWLVIVLVPPLLTMRLFAEERRVGTLEMLLTAPVGEVEVVLAKFGAGLAFYLAMWVPSLLYLAIVKSYGAIPDVGPIATSYLGIVLVGALFTAAGLFASSLTSTQVLAAVLATVFNLLLLLVPVLSQYVVRVESLERFFVELAIWRHFADSFAKGIVDTAHVAFYVLISVVFLFWTTRSLESQRWR
jgi:ABC-2 type transport system permease protein